MSILTTIFGLPLTFYGLSVTLALLIVLLGTAFQSRHHGYTSRAALRFALLAIPLCLLCSRVVYVAASYAYYLEDIGDWTLMLRFWDGGYSMMGALGGLVLAAFLAECWTKTPHGRLMDGMSLYLPLALSLARLAEGGTGLGEGGPVPDFWPSCLTIDTVYGSLHTVFLYEAIVADLIFIALFIWKLRCQKRRPGDVLLMFLLLFGCTQVVMESLRSDGHMTVHMGVAVQQVIAAVLIMIPLIIWTVRAARAPQCRRWWPALAMALAVAAIVLAVVAEFGVDRWASKLAAYGLMVICLIGLFEIAGISRRISYALTEEEENGTRED